MSGLNRTTCAVLRGAVYCVAVGLALHLAFFFAPPLPNTHPTDRANDLARKNEQFVPHGIMTAIACAAAGALAGFAATWPKYPLSFVRCLLAIVVCAGIARIISSPGFKGGSDWEANRSYIITFLGGVVGCALMTAAAFSPPIESQTRDDEAKSDSAAT